MIKFNKETLVELAGLGAGAAGSAYMKLKLLTKADGTSVFGSSQTASILTDATPVVVGLFLQGQSGFLKEAGKGMIAESVGSLIKAQIGLAGVDSPLMGYNEAPEIPSNPSAPLMGYSAGDSYDYNSVEAGEIGY